MKSLRIIQSGAGFTLIELSIVLVIIGLVVGGILVGRELIAAAQGRKLISSVEQLRTAVLAFKSKFNCLPGDCTNVTEIWGINGGACPGTGILPGAAGYANTCAFIENQPGTCNSNGDGRVGGGHENVEIILFWDHLARGLNIPTMRMGASAGAYAPCRYNSPPYDNIHFWPANSSNINGLWQNMWNQNYITMSNSATSIFSTTDGRNFTRQEALQIDIKYDDGVPAKGWIRGAFGAWGGIMTDPGSGAGVGCVTPMNHAAYQTAIYDTSATTKDCNLAFIGGY